MKTVIFFSFFLSFINIFSQVKVGENPNNINPSAVLEAESTSKGFLPPRMTTAQRDAIQNPALGLQIFNLTTNCLEIYIAPNWQNVFCGCSSAPANLSYTNNGPITYCLNTVISPNSATTQASTPSSFTVSPSLPAGLQLNNVIGQITGTPTSLSSSANYTITASNACGSTTRVLNIGVITVPATPPTISGPSAPTINTSTNYSITAVSGATSYTWTVPTGWIINSGQGTTIINVTSGSNAGNVTVTATNTCGTSTPSTKAVSSWRPIVATGGTVTNYTANGVNGTNGIQYRVHSFTTVGSSSFNVSDAGTDGRVDYLVVAGGGGGGKNAGAGGGAGGYRSNVLGELSGGNSSPEPSYSVSSQNYSIVIGAGGIGGNISDCSTFGGNGQSSSVFGIISLGGGSGVNSGGSNGNSGGSGGGTANCETGNRIGGSGVSGQGFKGGDGTIPGGYSRTGGGGGGAGGTGQNSVSSTQAGAGGSGLGSRITGTLIYYAGGGGGGVHSGNDGIGGIGGGGNGGSQAGVNGTGGGGGAGRSPNDGAQGGSGIIIIRYPLSNPNP